MRWICAVALSGIALAAPASALAAGGPAVPVQGGYGISAPGSPYRYVAVAGSRNATVVKRFGGDAAGSASSIRVGGAYGIPGVGSGGQTTGLAADGRTLVLAKLFGYPAPRTTRLLVLDTPRLAIRARIALPGWSIVDAISPDGRWLYLIHYPSSGDLSRYRVLAYNLVTRHMLAKPIVDPHDEDGEDAMVGFPVTRVMSADSRWAYTLYIRASGAPFIHALDTVGVRARCVDLPATLANIDIGNAQLTLDARGKTIRVDADGVTQALVNTHTFAVSAVPNGATALPNGPVTSTGAANGSVTSTGLTNGTVTSPAVARTPVARRASTRDSSGLPWELLLAAAALAVAGGAIQRRPRRRTG